MNPSHPVRPNVINFDPRTTAVSCMRAVNISQISFASPAKHKVQTHDHLEGHCNPRYTTPRNMVAGRNGKRLNSCRPCRLVILLHELDYTISHECRTRRIYEKAGNGKRKEVRWATDIKVSDDHALWVLSTTLHKGRHTRTSAISLDYDQLRRIANEP